MKPQELDDLVRLRRARDRMDRDYAEPLDVAALARDALMSSGHFSRSFRAAFGETPYSYLMTRRIERAKALLRRGDLTVTEVCFAVGCTSLGSFSTRFTELVGENPSSYRARDHEDGAAVPACIAKIHTRPVRNGEAGAAPGRSLGGMDIRLSQCFIAVDDHDKAIAFYRDVLGLEVRNDVGFEGMRWVTVGAPSQPDVNIVLEPPLADPNASSADRQAMAELMAKGLLRGVIFATDDCDAAFERVSAAAWGGVAGADGPALRRPRLRVPRSGRQPGAVHPGPREVTPGGRARWAAGPVPDGRSPAAPGRSVRLGAPRAGGRWAGCPMRRARARSGRRWCGRWRSGRRPTGRRSPR